LNNENMKLLYKIKKEASRDIVRLKYNFFIDITALKVVEVDTKKYSFIFCFFKSIDRKMIS